MKAQRWLGVMVLGACLLVGSLAAAQEPRELAKQHFTAGEQKYKAGDYQGAIVDFMAADALVPSPILSFNIALCHEKLGQKEGAVKLYRDYLTRRPDAPNRATVEGRISTLEAEIAAAAAAQPPADPPPDGTEMPADVLDKAEPPAEAVPPTPAEAPRRAYDDALARRVPDRSSYDGSAYPAPGAAPPDPAPGPADPAPMAPEPTRRSTPVYKQWWFWVVVGVSALIILDVAAGPDGSSGSSAADSTGAVLWRF